MIDAMKLRQAMAGATESERLQIVAEIMLATMAERNVQISGASIVLENTPVGDLPIFVVAGAGPAAIVLRRCVDILFEELGKAVHVCITERGPMEGCG